MISYLIGVLLIAAACLFIVVRKTYLAIPAKELKRRAMKNDSIDAELYRAVAYDKSLVGLLWFLVILFITLGLVAISRSIPFVFSFITVAVLVFLVFVWLPTSRLSKFGQKITLLLNPVIVGLLGYLDPVLKKIVNKTENFSHKEFHSGLFEKQDLIEIIEKLEHQKDSRFSEEELEIAKRVLEFNDKSVKDVMTLRKKVKAISPDTTIGPVLADELHKNGQKFTLVRSSGKAPIEGFLDYTKLDLQRSGKVKDYMEKTVYYVHQDDRLSEALKAFKITNHPILVVVNSHEDCVGIIGVENILSQLLGHIPGDDFDQYADLAAVSNKHLKIHQFEDEANV